MITCSHRHGRPLALMWNHCRLCLNGLNWSCAYFQIHEIWIYLLKTLWADLSPDESDWIILVCVVVLNVYHTLIRLMILDLVSYLQQFHFLKMQWKHTGLAIQSITHTCEVNSDERNGSLKKWFIVTFHVNIMYRDNDIKKQHFSSTDLLDVHCVSLGLDNTCFCFCLVSQTVLDSSILVRVKTEMFYSLI